jgi:hypothetical protein
VREGETRTAPCFKKTKEGENKRRAESACACTV